MRITEERHAELLEAERDRYRAAERECDSYREVLAELVRLKDGPRDAAYERDKPKAWQAARDALRNQWWVA